MNDNEQERYLSLPEPLVQGVIDYLKTQPYEDVFQMIAAIMQVVQDKAGQGQPEE